MALLRSIGLLGTALCMTASIPAAATAQVYYASPAYQPVVYTSPACSDEALASILRGETPIPGEDPTGQCAQEAGLSNDPMDQEAQVEALMKLAWERSELEATFGVWDSSVDSIDLLEDLAVEFGVELIAEIDAILDDIWDAAHTGGPVVNAGLYAGTIGGTDLGGWVNVVDTAEPSAAAVPIPFPNTGDPSGTPTEIRTKLDLTLTDRMRCTMSGNEGPDDDPDDGWDQGECGGHSEEGDYPGPPDDGTALAFIPTGGDFPFPTVTQANAVLCVVMANLLEG